MVFRATVVVCVLACVSPLVHAVQVTECRLDTPGVYVSISAERETVDNSSLRWLEVNWFGMDVQDGDFVALLEIGDAGEERNLLSWTLVSEPDGVHRTDEVWDGSLIPSTVENAWDACLPYEAVYMRAGATLHSSCLMMRPRWLQSLKTELWETPLTKVVLPGTHDAGAAGDFDLELIGDLVGRWVFTQDESLWQQLVIGARYLDMRIAYYNDTEEKFFVNHGEAVIAPLQGYLDDVMKFMMQTEEIVIFDIHRLVSGFNGYPERHQELIALLELSFSAWMVPRSLAPNPTMGQLWESGGRLITTYPSPEGLDSSYLWNSVYHLWGDVNTLEDLEAYMYTGIPEQENRGSLWSAMAEFTPSTLDVAMNRWGGLRGAATITNFPVTNWFRQDWWSKVNIIAMDFLPSSDVVSVAVEANRARRLCAASEVKLSAEVKRWWTAAKTSTDYGTIIKSKDSGDARVWLWVSALASTSPEGQTTHRQLEVNWETAEVLEGDWVGIFDSDPQEDWSAPEDAATPTTAWGYHLTNHTLPNLPVNTNLEEGGCLGWWAAYIRNDVPIAADCIKVHPRWMALLEDKLGGVPLRSLVISGVHDAGTYTPYVPEADNPLMKYAITQDESIYRQLVYGHRYIDLRAGYFSAEPEEPYWVVHGITVWRPFRDVLEQLRDFVQQTGEVVVVEVSGFTFFETSEHHAGCISLIVEELGGHMAAANLTWDAPLRDLLHAEASVIITYNNQEADDHPLFWPRIPGRFGNVQTLDQLEAFMTDVFEVEGPPSPPWILSGQLTPLADDVVTDSLGGLRTMADQVNRHVTHWVRDIWWEQINIISCDFTLSSGYVEAAIEANLKRVL